VWLKYQAYQGLEVVAPAGHLCTMGNRQRGVNRVVMAARDLDAGIELVSSIAGRGCPAERWIGKHFLTA